MNAIEVRSAYKYFGNVKDPKVVLNRLNMTVRYGSIYGLLGPSGCGKTILLSCIVGLKTFDDGSVMVLGGKPGSKKSGVPGPKVGYQPQELALVGEFTVRETIFYFAKIYGMTNEKIHERYEFLRNLLQLPDGDMYIEHCSNGQQRCVSFAASVVHEPKLLILDEPTAGLDPLLRERIWDYLVDASQNKNLTVIITTHFIEEAKQADCVSTYNKMNQS
jgi:ABC-type multidrug transport system ATPase subunit